MDCCNTDGMQLLKLMITEITDIWLSHQGTMCYMGRRDRFLLITHTCWTASLQNMWFPIHLALIEYQPRSACFCQGFSRASSWCASTLIPSPMKIAPGCNHWCFANTGKECGMLKHFKKSGITNVLQNLITHRDNEGCNFKVPNYQSLFKKNLTWLQVSGQSPQRHG